MFDQRALPILVEKTTNIVLVQEIIARIKKTNKKPY